MSDTATVAALAALVVLVVLAVWWTVQVWSGRARGWFHSDSGWHYPPHLSNLCWPGPLVAAMVAVAAVPLMLAVDAAEAAGYPPHPGWVAAGLLLPAGWLTLFPRRWMFPPWVHRRITPLADPTTDDDACFVALHSLGPPYGSGQPSWLIAFDAVAGQVTLTETELVFEATGPLPDLPATERHRPYSDVALRTLRRRALALAAIRQVRALPLEGPARRRPGGIRIDSDDEVCWLFVADRHAAVTHIRAAAGLQHRRRARRLTT